MKRKRSTREPTARSESRSSLARQNFSQKNNSFEKKVNGVFRPENPRALPKNLAEVLHLIEQAFKRRGTFKVPPMTNIRRWVHGAADALPGLVVESYGQCARLELKDTFYVPWAEPIGEKLLQLGMTGVVFVLRTGKKAQVRPLLGHCPSGIVATEAGKRFFVRLVEGDAVGTGIFVDLRNGRSWAQKYARNQPFLNLFAHAGAYGVAALRGGASRIDHVDSGKKTAAWAALNIALNGGDPRAHRFIIDDAFDFLKRAGRRGATYGFIACDPPTTALRPKGKRFVVRESLPILAEDGCRALLPKGRLLLSCNDRSLTTAHVEQAARLGAQKAGRKVLSIKALALPDDLPAGGDIPVRGVLMQIQ